ncbi:MAG TPA: hypothetical protein VGW74_09300 [Propionibacteriaceae bacterium]|nr:hypothetical protein [Propionibacteriaceae bacterium]
MSDQPPPAPGTPWWQAKKAWLAVIPLLLVALLATQRALEDDTAPPVTTTTTEATTTTEPPVTGTTMEPTTTSSSTSVPGGNPTRAQVIDDAGPVTLEGELRRAGNLTIDRPGQVVEGVYVTGVVTFTAAADGATLRDCVVEGARSTNVVHVSNGATDVTVEHCRLEATANSEGVVGSLGGAPRQTVRANVIEGLADGIKADSDSLYEANVIHVWKPSGSTAHRDGLQASGRHDVVARWNVVTSTITDGLNRRPVALAEFRNAHGWSPSIWHRLLANRGFKGYIFDGGPYLDRLWQSIEELPEWQQAPLVLTFDTGVVPHQAFEWAADNLDEFDARLPADDGHVNHVPAMAELLRSGVEAPLFGVWGTSVTENPFDPWDEEADDYGSGIYLWPGDGDTQMYVLERHRHLLPPPLKVASR